ncbi:MAG TPA: tRNA (N6-threonylcarbamoyladenosine(37)-N6)-methyltransferase TrmO [Spirochaetota bacterium]|nr:tRNA (N6-threonylcarbamoyladenosine(37)-N6)-methyltransferase TrmO [Spirochaetota bacterium]HOT20709.1 tRNA (N6-threonylcarbamoyladenosine(37)-N6)-methyltransferase TrmO [Spirochaetota bacterium]HPD05046.1 tRNA (N6-threonylcarbamoyladenosine(37)-N6)-methyltransferase TrmO [Spirochaetota bacterium]HPK44867.1 tRNA (N6-threonylcarbamoyladenosine(37)-N6)-methyltransferase TrmO [Spirochaetota bacterium]HQG42417.1 tRNA (N6-threonylcarbamoyladenosine(37)-N6)-methyltransferase TrmO [Spirochaetota ba
MESISYPIKPIGYIRHRHKDVPRHWSLSELEGEIVIDEDYALGIHDIKAGNLIVVLFLFDRAVSFTMDRLIVKPPHCDEYLGVFSTCSPVRPNPIGLSIVEVLEVHGFTIKVKRIDMFDGTPVLDIKPYIPYMS